MQIQFLEEWLRICPNTPQPPPPSASPSSSARDIIQAWSQLRDSIQHSTFQPHHLHSLESLNSSQTSLHVAEPQAKLLLSLLSLPAQPELKTKIYGLSFKILYIWVRKSKNPSPSLLESTVSALSKLLSIQGDKKMFISEGILLLGAISSVPILPQSSREVCLELLDRLLKEEYQAIGFMGFVPEVLAGIGYALSSSKGINFDRILCSLLGIWNREDGNFACVNHGLMILHLMEWLVSGFVSSRLWEKMELAVRVVSDCGVEGQFGRVMAAAGILRGWNRYANGVEFLIAGPMRNSVEGVVEFVARDLISKNGTLFDSGKILVSGSNDLDHSGSDRSLFLRCIALGLARCGSISYRAPVLICLAMALLAETFPLSYFYRRAYEDPHGSSNSILVDEVREHVGSILFKEAGATTRAFCNQYALADQDQKLVVENFVWNYAQEIYSKHRLVALAFRGMKELLGELEKITEAAFLMIVVFASIATKHKIDPGFSHEVQSDISVRALAAFSCIEFFRHVRLQEYSDTVRRTVLYIQENGSACASLVDSVPSYAELTNLKVHSYMGEVEYHWYEDEVQTARILFYWRVLATCTGHIPALLFKKSVVPSMFLYMRHPAEKVARAAHSVFAAFISSGKDLHQENNLSLKEQLVFYYMQRALEAYPGITPFEGMVSGVVALVRHLPAGSSSTLYCIHVLTEKCKSLCSKAMIENADLWGNRQEETEPCRKVVELLIRLISLVDIQVLPSLLKLLAQLIVQLPNQGQNAVLDEIYAQVAESDDVTRKPILVSWLQSVSYLCSHNTQRILNSSTAKDGNGEHDNVSACKTGNLYLNSTSSRL